MFQCNLFYSKIRNDSLAPPETTGMRAFFSYFETKGLSDNILLGFIFSEDNRRQKCQNMIRRAAFIYIYPKSKRSLIDYSISQDIYNLPDGTLHLYR